MLFFLPSKPINRLSELPKTPGVYYITAWWIVFYVGKSKNLHRRWQSHHRHAQFAALQPFGRLHYKQLSFKKIHNYELAEIARLKPKWNYQAIASFWQRFGLFLDIWLRGLIILSIFLGLVLAICFLILIFTPRFFGL
jgi:hypothetical protein